MINAIGSAGIARGVELRGDAVARSEPVLKAGGTPTEGASPANPAADLASQGAPIDSDKIAAIRAKIAQGGYRIDPHAIARSMIALDLPVSA